MLSYIPYCKILNMLGTHSCTSCTGHMQICIAFSPLKITFDCKIPFGQNALFLICMRELGIGLWVSFMDSLSPWCCDHPSNYCVPGTLNSQRLVWGAGRILLGAWEFFPRKLQQPLDLSFYGLNTCFLKKGWHESFWVMIPIIVCICVCPLDLLLTSQEVWSAALLWSLDQKTI